MNKLINTILAHAVLLAVKRDIVFITLRDPQKPSKKTFSPDLCEVTEYNDQVDLYLFMESA